MAAPRPLAAVRGRRFVRDQAAIGGAGSFFAITMPHVCQNLRAPSLSKGRMPVGNPPDISTSRDCLIFRLTSESGGICDCQESKVISTSRDKYSVMAKPDCTIPF